MGFPGLLSTIMLIVVLIMLLANRNPLYLMGLFVVYLLSKVMWVQMDIPGQFQHGTVSMEEKMHHLFAKFSCSFDL